MSTESSLAHSYPVPKRDRRPGASSAGQAGDTQGLPESAELGDESVKDLAEEGQAFEAELLMGLETSLDETGTEVHTRELLEDDVPAEYQDAVEPPRSEKG